jgi:hypothetical protein
MYKIKNLPKVTLDKGLEIQEVWWLRRSDRYLSLKDKVRVKDLPKASETE